jgi:hypothetical protein
MGHSSIQVTADIYGHLIPGADIKCVDGLDRETSSQQNATQAQPEPNSEKEAEAEPSEVFLPRRILVRAEGIESAIKQQTKNLTEHSWQSKTF